jgi:hypothetical protein
MAFSSSGCTVFRRQVNRAGKRPDSLCSIGRRELFYISFQNAFKNGFKTFFEAIYVVF